MNLYAFCGNNGINKWDMLGMDPLSDWIDENGPINPAPGSAAVLPAGYSPTYYAGYSEYNEGMFLGDGSWAGVLQIDAAAGVSWQGQAEQAMGDARVGVDWVMARNLATAIASGDVSLGQTTSGRTVVVALGDTASAAWSWTAGAISEAYGSNIITGQTRYDLGATHIPGDHVTLDQARVQATLASKQMSEQNQWEYRSWYYQNADGSYSYTETKAGPNWNGGAVYEPQLENGTTAVGYAHSHSVGGYDTYLRHSLGELVTPSTWREREESFSGADVLFSASTGYEISQGTPSGRLIYYTSAAAASAIEDSYDPQGTYPGLPMPGAPRKGP